jgi:tetratricopeptide (TPR) repeat protein
VAVDAFEEQPVRGIGAGSFESWWGVHASIPLFVRNPHSLVVQQLAELGLAGILLFAGFIAALLFAAVRQLRWGPRADTAVLLGLLVAAGVVAAEDWIWQFPACFGPAVVAAAMLMARTPGRALARRAPGTDFLVVVAGLAALAGAGSLALTELRLEQSRDAAAAGRIETATKRAEQAHDAQPFASKPYVQLALLEEQQGDFGRALAYVEEARERDQGDWRLAALQARLLESAGDKVGAAQAIARGARLAPQPSRAELDFRESRERDRD